MFYLSRCRSQNFLIRISIIVCLLISNNASSTLPSQTKATLHLEATEKLERKLTELCWIAYAPTNFNPQTDPPLWPSSETVREDLQVLVDAGFGGLVTYGSDYREQQEPEQLIDIPGLAQEAGFQAMVVGVWNPESTVELEAAKHASEHAITIGYVIGNEGLGVRYDLKTLELAMQDVRDFTNLPVTTTEESHDYHLNSPLWRISDWIFMNVHPYFSNVRTPREAANWTSLMFETFDQISNKPLAFKEVGLPAVSGDSISEYEQAEYYQYLKETNITNIQFEAFDSPWKALAFQTDSFDPEPHWGFFTSERLPKKVAKNICAASSVPSVEPI